jgi:hypothetical protein
MRDVIQQRLRVEELPQAIILGRKIGQTADWRRNHSADVPGRAHSHPE